MWAGALTRRLSLDDRRPRGWPATVATTEPTSTDNPSHLGDFGANEWLVEDMYERFLADPDSVDAAWHDFFAHYRPPRQGAPHGAKPPAARPPAARAPPTGPNPPAGSSADPPEPAGEPAATARTEGTQNRATPAA